MHVEVREFVGVGAVVDLGGIKGGLDSAGGAGDDLRKARELGVGQLEQLVHTFAIDDDTATAMSLLLKKNSVITCIGATVIVKSVRRWSGRNKVSHGDGWSQVFPESDPLLGARNDLRPESVSEKPPTHGLSCSLNYLGRPGLIRFQPMPW